MVSNKPSTRTAAKRHAPVRQRAARKTTRPAKTVAAIVSEPVIDEIAMAGAASILPPVIEIEPPRKQKKLKVVRDSFTMPAVDHQRLGNLKKRFVAQGSTVKKSELLRAGLHLLERLDDLALLGEIGRLDNVRTGRPNNHELAKGGSRKDSKKSRKKK